jgi:hypothetical protein
MKVVPLLLAAIIFIAVVPVAMGHAAPPPRDFETRILHDHNDDSAYALAGKHGFDTIALDVREGALPSGEDALIMRLLLNGGCNANLPDPCGSLSLSVEFDVDGAAQTVEFVTGDGGANWTGSAAYYTEPMGINDGTRFAIEAWVPMQALGISEGSVLSNLFVDAADRMPEGLLAGQPDPLDGAFDIGSYTVGASNFYLSASSQDEVDVNAGQEVELSFTLTNKLVATQAVTLGANQTGVFKLGNETIETLELAAGAVKNITFVTSPIEAGAIRLSASSDLGGYAAAEVALLMESVQPSSITSPAIAPGDSWSYSFVGPGTFSYHNHANPEVGGKIVVVAASGGANRIITYDGAAFSPAELAASVGDVIFFQNNGDAPMTIMGSVGETHEHDDHGHDEPPEEGIPGPAIGLVLLGLLVLARRRN